MSGWEWSAPDVEKLHELHAAGLHAHGGLAGPPKPGCLEGARGAAINAGMYIDDSGEPHYAVIAACLLYYIAKNQCFSDGNKRLGWMALIEALAGMGLTILATTSEAHDFVLAVANGALDRDGTIEWVVERLEAVRADA